MAACLLPQGNGFSVKERKSILNGSFNWYASAEPLTLLVLLFNKMCTGQ